MKRMRILAVLLALCLLLSACQSKITSPETKAEEKEEQTDTAQVSFPYTFTDSVGNSITLEKKPENVAVLFSSFADVWKTAGGNVDITVGESVERGFADENAVIVDPSTGHSSIDLEGLANARPDLVIGTADYESQTKAVDFCKDVGINAALFRVETFDDYLYMLKICCDLTGNTEKYKTFGTDVGERIDEMLQNVKTKTNDKDILFVRAGSSAKSTKAKNSEDNFVCRMLSQLGTRNIADTDSELVGELSLERILVENPDYLFITTMGSEDAAKDYMNSLLQSDGWKELTCVKSGNYCFLPKNLFHYKPNSHWDEAYKYLINILCSEEK